jgi:hypothetical protein
MENQNREPIPPSQRKTARGRHDAVRADSVI